MNHHNRPRPSSLALAISLRDWKARLTLILFGLLALVFLILARSENPAMTAARSALTDLLAPTVGFLSSPIQASASLGEKWQQWQNVAAENEQLRAEIAQLKQWQVMGAELHAENESLRQLLNLAPASAKHFVSGRMIGNLAGPFSQSQFINIGSADGVIKDMTVIAGEGLVGRVLEVGNFTSRVMLVTDINSHIAVVSQHSREQAVAFGRNDALIELRYLNEKTKLKLGEMVLTSGDAKLIPAGLPLGRVVKIENGKVLVKPIVDWARLSHVSLIAD